MTFHIGNYTPSQYARYLPSSTNPFEQARAWVARAMHNIWVRCRGISHKINKNDLKKEFLIHYRKAASGEGSETKIEQIKNIFNNCISRNVSPAVRQAFNEWVTAPHNLTLSKAEIDECVIEKLEKGRIAQLANENVSKDKRECFNFSIRIQEGMRENVNLYPCSCKKENTVENSADKVREAIANRISNYQQSHPHARHLTLFFIPYDTATISQEMSREDLRMPEQVKERVNDLLNKFVQNSRI